MLTRIDALADYTHFRDTGCSLHSSCLACPLPVCREDEDAPHLPRLAIRNERMLARLTDGLSKGEVAVEFDVSLRTVDRARWAAK